MNIYIGNLPYKAGEEEIKELFGSYGQIDSVKVITDRVTGNSKGFAFIEMPSDDEAQAAIENLNGKEFMERNLIVNKARPRPERREGGGGRGGRDGGYNNRRSW